MPISIVRRDIRTIPEYEPVDGKSPTFSFTFDRRAIAASATLISLVCVATYVLVEIGLGSARGLRWSPENHGAVVLQESAESEVTWDQGADFPSQAPPMDVDVEYVVNGGWGTNYDHIPTPEMCSAMCQGVDKCKSYTWVKDAGLPGCPSQCWLKGAVGTKKNQKGVVSGVPPKRKELVVPPAIRGSEFKSLYCWALMVPGSYEQDMLKWQSEHNAGIFGCDQAAVYSNKHLSIAPGIETEYVNTSLKCGYGGDSQSALNSWIFIAVWQKVIEVQDYKKHDFVVKADPDTVFFANRLKRLLVKHDGAAYINNCRYGMHGPIEVFGTESVEALAVDYHRSWDGKAPKKCVSEQHFGQWGEDMFMDQCLHKILEVSPRPTDENLLCESHCKCDAWYWCNEGPDVVSYHPFKSVSAYKNCMANAGGDSLSEVQ